MGSRRKRRNLRSAEGLPNVSRQARVGSDKNLAPLEGPPPPLPLAEAVVDSSPTQKLDLDLRLQSTQKDAGEPRQDPVLTTSGITNRRSSSSSVSQTGSNPRISDTGRHPKVVPVTRQTEDGTFELIYEKVEEQTEDDDDLEFHMTPVWRSRGVLIALGALGVIGILVLAGIGISSILDGDKNSGPRKVRAGHDNLKPGPKKTYEYVPPKQNDGKINLDEEDPGGSATDEALPDGTAVDPPGARPRGNRGSDLNAAPPNAAQTDPNRPKRAGGANPGLDFKAGLPNPGSTRLGDPMHGVKPDILHDKLGRPAAGGGSASSGSAAEEEDDSQDERPDDEDSEAEEDNDEEDEGEEDEDEGEEDEDEAEEASDEDADPANEEDE